LFNHEDKKIEAVSVAGGEINGDLYGYEERLFWVLDGATALVTPYVPASSMEVRWLVNKVDEVLRLKGK